MFKDFVCIKQENLKHRNFCNSQATTVENTILRRPTWVKLRESNEEMLKQVVGTNSEIIHLPFSQLFSNKLENDDLCIDLLLLTSPFGQPLQFLTTRPLYLLTKLFNFSCSEKIAIFLYL